MTLPRAANVNKPSKKKVDTYYAALGRFVTVWAQVELI
jgi:hypothetical protein